MSQFNDDEKRRLFQTLDMHSDQNAKIERGLYGDPENKVKGALDQIEDLKGQIHKIEYWILKHNLKTAFISGVTASVVLFAKMVGSWFFMRSEK